MQAIKVVTPIAAAIGVLAFIPPAQRMAAVPAFVRSEQSFGPNARTWETAMGDLDADGDVDAVMGCLEGPTIMFFNDGKGAFTRADQEFPKGMHGIAIGDVDLDGNPDLFFAPLGSTPEPAVYLNDGKGSFAPSPHDLALTSSEEVFLIDMEKDGDLDAYLLWKGLYFINDGHGKYTKGDLSLPEIVDFADLNGDGYVDVISVTLGRGFTVYVNDQGGAFAEHSFVEVGGLAFSYQGFADVDNDDDIDVIYTNGSEEERQPAGVLLNDGQGVFTESGQKLSAVEYGYVGTGDFDNDGWVDVVITDRGGPAAVWFNDGEGKFVDSGLKLGEGQFWSNCIVEDVDNDGDLDIFVTKRIQGDHGLWLNQLVENSREEQE